MSEGDLLSRFVAQKCTIVDHVHQEDVPLLYITGLDFTVDVQLFDHLQNRGEELLSSATKRLMKSLRFPFVLVVTCDRAEVIGLGKTSCEVMERALNLNPIAVSKCRYSLEGEEAERHVFLLASGIISPLFGEDTIQGQLAMAGEVARLSGSSSGELNKLINMAVAFSKDLHTRQKIRVFDRTIADAVALRLRDRKRILITGSGEAARIVASRLLEDDHEIHIALRDESKTFLILPGTKAVAYDERMEEATWADAVVSASSGLYYTFSKEECQAIAPKPMYDLAFPYDLPDCSNVVRTKDLGVEEPEKEKVIKQVEKEAEMAHGEYLSWLERSRGYEKLAGQGEDLSYEVMRRLSGPVASLNLDGEAERQLRLSILDSVKKAYIGKSYSWKEEE